MLHIAPYLYAVSEEKDNKRERLQPRNHHQSVSKGYNKAERDDARRYTPCDEVADTEIPLAGLWDFHHDRSCTDIMLAREDTQDK